MILPRWVGPAAVVVVLAGTHWVAYNQGRSSESDRRDALTAAEVVEARTVEQAQAATIKTEVERTNETIAAVPDNRDELERLRESNTALRRELSDTAAAAKRGEAATKAGVVYGELLERATARIAGLERTTARAVELAERYDVAHARGELCVVTYESMASSR